MVANRPLIRKENSDAIAIKAISCVICANPYLSYRYKNLISSRTDDLLSFLMLSFVMQQIPQIDNPCSFKKRSQSVSGAGMRDVVGQRGPGGREEEYGGVERANNLHLVRKGKNQSIPSTRDIHALQIESTCHIILRSERTRFARWKKERRERERERERAGELGKREKKEAKTIVSGTKK
jgi:hypothetical protein